MVRPVGITKVTIKRNEERRPTLGTPFLSRIFVKILAVKAFKHPFSKLLIIAIVIGAMFFSVPFYVFLIHFIILFILSMFVCPCVYKNVDELFTKKN